MWQGLATRRKALSRFDLAKRSPCKSFRFLNCALIPAALELVSCATATAPARSPVPTAARLCAFPELGLRLPFEDTIERRVSQGNGGSSSHNGRLSFAWDFDMPEGTTVLAASDGIVVETIDGYSEGGLNDRLRERVNRVVIDHGGARFSMYDHLQRHSVLVHVGQLVTRGQPIGRSGSTGYSAGPHLHFVVVDQRSRSLPVCFADVEDGVPVEGKSYRPSPVASRPLEQERRAPPRVPSFLPRDTFAQNGILLTADIPAHLFTGGERIDAVVLRPAKTALAVFDRRDRSLQRVIPAHVAGDGRFSVVVSAEILAEVGPPIDFALVLLGPDDKWGSDFTVPIFFSAASGSGAGFKPARPE